MSTVFGGGGQAETVNPPKPLKIKLNQMENEMVAGDQAAYQAADDYMAKYYPALTGARDKMISQAYDAITGPLDPTLENTFVNRGNMQSAAALGGGDQSFGLGKGSLACNAAAASVAQDTQANQDYNLSAFENLTGIYAPRGFGMTPEDAANIFTFNNTQIRTGQCNESRMPLWVTASANRTSRTQVQLEANTMKVVWRTNAITLSGAAPTK